MTFGDGASNDLGASSAATQTAQHAYQAGGTYTATVTANDSSGGTASASTVLVVSQPLLVSLSISKNVLIATLTATVSPPGAMISNYHWVYGDGNSADTASNTSSHTYLMGSYTASVTVTAPNGQTATSSTSFIMP
jgi:PKD repeat protein